jgi:uncharacterized protein (DUF342 family)
VDLALLAGVRVVVDVFDLEQRAAGERAAERVQRLELVDDLGDLLPAQRGHGGRSVVGLVVAAGPGHESAVLGCDDEQAVGVAEDVVPAAVGHEPHDQCEQ